MSNIEDVLIALRRVIRATDIHSRQLVRTTGVTTPQILLLQVLQNRGRQTVSELAHELCLSQATVTTIIDRLENKGLVYRQRSDRDKRMVFINLTDKASDILMDAPPPLQEHFSANFQALAEWEQAMIVSALQRVAKMMDAEAIDASPVLDIDAIAQQNHDKPD